MDLIIAPLLNNGDNGHQWPGAGIKLPWPPINYTRLEINKIDKKWREGGKRKMKWPLGEMATTNVRLHVREKEKGRAQSSDRRTGELEYPSTQQTTRGEGVGREGRVNEQHTRVESNVSQS